MPVVARVRRVLPGWMAATVLLRAAPGALPVKVPMVMMAVMGRRAQQGGMSGSNCLAITRPNKFLSWLTGARAENLARPVAQGAAANPKAASFTVPMAVNPGALVWRASRVRLVRRAQ